MFKDTHKLDKRKSESKRIRLANPGMIPIICERNNLSVTNLPILKKKKYLVRDDLNLGTFVMTIRKSMELNPECAIFLIFGEKMFSNSDLISSIYEKNKDEDGFLYCTYSEENIFGFLN